MMLNTSGTCATTRLVQLRDFGVHMNDVSRKFDNNEPENVPDLSRDDFLARRKVLDQVRREVNSRRQAGTDNDWTLILYMYEVCVLILWQRGWERGSPCAMQGQTRMKIC